MFLIPRFLTALCWRAHAQECSCPLAARSLPWRLYSLALISVLVPSTVLALFLDRANARRGHASLRMQTTTDELVSFCDILSITASTAIIFVQACFSQHSLFVLLDQLRQVDRLLGMRPPAVSGLLATWLLLLVAVVVMDGSMWTELSKGFLYTACYFPFYALYVTTFVMEAMFIDDAHAIYMRFLALNEKLRAALMVPSYLGQPPCWTQTQHLLYE